MNKKLVFALALSPLLSSAFFAPLAAQNQPTATQIAAQTAAVVRGPWCGAVTANSALVKAKVAPGASVRLLVSGGGSKKVSGVAVAPATGLVALPLDGLSADTRYVYALEVNGKVAPTRGRFQTFPGGAASFNFAFASCARSYKNAQGQSVASNHPIFRTILKNKPLFFLHMGDLHYEDLNTLDRDAYRAAYDMVLNSPSQSELYRNVPITYMWDDHDYAGNGSDLNAKGKEAARLTYQEYVPHYPLPAGSGNVPIYQAFTVGRVRFIIGDLRSDRSDPAETDSAQKSMLGAAQKAWLKSELLAAKGKYPLIFWMSSVTWNARAVRDARSAKNPAEADFDNWSAYDTERKEIVDFIKKNDIKGLCILSGDAHMLAADSGKNVKGYTGLEAPVIQAGSLDQYNSMKGGPKFDRGFYGPREDLSKDKADPLKFEGCYGWMTVKDTGNQIAVRFSGRNQDDKEMVSLDFTVPATP